MADRDFTLHPLQFHITGFDEFHAFLRYLVCDNRRLECWIDENRNSICDKFESFSDGDRLRLLNIFRYHTMFEEYFRCEPLRDFFIGKLDFLQQWPGPDEVFVHLLAWADLRDEIIISLWTSAERHTGLFNRWLLFQDRHIIDLIDSIITRNVIPMSMSLHHTSVGGDITFTSNMSNIHLYSISSPHFQSLGSIHSTHDNGCRFYSGLRPAVALIVHNNDGTLSQSHVSISEFMPNSLPNNVAIASPESDMRNINPPYLGTRITQSHIWRLEFMPNSSPNNAASTLESRSLRPVESDDNPSGHDGEFSSGHTEEARVTTDDETARYSKLFRTVFSSLLTTIFPVFNILKPDSWRSKPLSIKVSANLTGTFAAAAVLSSLVGVALTNLKPYILPYYRNPQPQLERNILKVAVHSTAYAFIGAMCHLFLQDDPLIMWIVACISYAAFTATLYFLGRSGR